MHLKLLSAICGEPTSVFSGHIDVECDYFQTYLERNDYRSNINELNLEGTLQSKTKIA